MKKIALLIAFFAPLAVFAQKPASVDSLIQVVNELKKEFHEYDSISRLYMGYLYRNLDKPRFKMYQTENIYNLLKLDTRTGRVWQVQYRMKNVQPFVETIGSILGIVFEDDGWDGRFELYPTKNMYNFILLDTGTGDTYQVQWGESDDYRFVRKLE